VSLPVLVLTAGLGTRLDPITRLVAKPAVPLAGSTLIEHVLAWLRREGATDVVLNLHSRPETIAGIVGDGRHLGLRVRYSWENPILGSAGGPRRALSMLGADTFLIVNGDTLCDVQLAPMIAAHERSAADVTMAVIPNPAPDRYNGIVADADGRVSGFVPKGHADRSWHFVGVQVVNAAVFAPLPDGVAAETVAGLYRDLVATGTKRLCIWPVSNSFVDVGTPRDYLEADRQLRRDSSIPLRPRRATIDPSAKVRDCIIWPNATIAANVELNHCIVAGVVSVPAGLCASNRVLVPSSLRQPHDVAETVEGVALFPV